MSRFGSAGHLARRFFTSLWPGRPATADDGWARSFLNPGEQALWRRMSGADQRHALAVARRVAAGADEPASAIPAALMHDVGKLEAGLGPFRRVAATAGALAMGHARLSAGDGRVARYLRHDALGATLLEQAGSDPLTVAWAREHHLPATRWTVPAAIGESLKAADDD